MAVTFGLDISHHQPLSLDLAACRRDGCEFVFLKATEGTSFVDSDFRANLAEARRAGMLVAAYHYQRAGTSAAAQAAHIARVVPKDVPVIPDVEEGSGSISLTRDLVTRLRRAGYTVPFSYIPRWYWQQLGSPSLAGLPPLWSSRYPDMTIGALHAEWADVPSTHWNGYGGLPVAVLQFTSSARIGGYAPLDANAYRGTRAQLAAQLGNTGGASPAPAAAPPSSLLLEDDIMKFEAVEHGTMTLPIPERDVCLQIQYAGEGGTPGSSLQIHSIQFMDGDGKKRTVTPGGDGHVPAGDPWWGEWLAPKGNECSVVIRYSYTGPGAVKQHVATAGWRRNYSN